MVSEGKLRVLAVGAHPDDCDLKAGGTAALYASLGHEVLFLSMTNGDTGHHEIGGGQLARKRHAEASAAAALAGITYRCFDIHSGELVPSVEYRRMLIQLIREYAPDLVMTHRPNDYHPDHRYGSQLLQDAMYLVTVPNNTPLTPHLSFNPVVVYFSDDFRQPTAFTPDIVVGIDSTMEKKIDMLDCHVSQMYEWLPYNRGQIDRVPADAKARREWLGAAQRAEAGALADRYREAACALYGPERGKAIRYAEAYGICEYGGQLTPEKIQVYFPFFK